MKMPNQSPPVMRSVSPAAMLKPGVNASQGITCQLCLAACNQLSGLAKTLCIAACDATVC
ncbi:MAG: hypothetical protein WCA36_09475 [Pseudolabrys sp.]|jgi:hypothetical protein